MPGFAAQCRPKRMSHTFLLTIHADKQVPRLGTSNGIRHRCLLPCGTRVRISLPKVLCRTRIEWSRRVRSLRGHDDVVRYFPVRRYYSRDISDCHLQASSVFVLLYCSYFSPDEAYSNEKIMVLL